MEAKVINYTNKRIASWYALAKEDYGIIGSGTTRIQGNRIFVDYEENGVKKTWSMAYYPEYVNENGINFFFDCWSEVDSFL